MKYILHLAAMLLIATVSYAQLSGYQATAGIKANGNLLKVIPLAQVVVCNYPASGGFPCTNFVQTYSSPTGSVQCSTATQIVAPGSQVCTATADSQGQFQFFVQSPQTVAYFFKYLTTWFGPYIVTMGGSGTTLAGTPNQTVIASNQVSLANPINTPGPITVPGNSVLQMAPQPVCLGQFGTPQLSFWTDGNGKTWPMFYDGTSSDCVMLSPAKPQVNGYVDGQLNAWCSSCNSGTGDFEPPATTRGLSFNSVLGYYVSKSGTAGCTTGSSIGNNCASPIVVSWPSALPNSNYSVSCTGQTPTNVPSAPYVVTSGKTATSVTLNYVALTAAAASFATVDCLATLD